MAYYGARWKAKSEATSRGLIKVKTLEDRAVEIVAPRFGYKTTDVARDMIHRARAGLQPALKRWVMTMDPEHLWALELDRTPSTPRRGRRKGALKT